MGAAAADGVELLALTDHDSAEGIADALEAASAHGLRLVPGVEISTSDCGQPDLHILGYLIDHRDRTLTSWPPPPTPGQTTAVPIATTTTMTTTNNLASQALIACYASQKATVDLTCAQAAVAEVQAE